MEDSATEEVLTTAVGDVTRIEDVVGETLLSGHAGHNVGSGQRYSP